MAATANAAVPVDRFTIVNGPGTTFLLGVSLRLQDRDRVNPLADNGVPVRFTLKTPASVDPFSRMIKICTLYGYDAKEGAIEFTAIFDNRYVEGTYNFRTKTGWFHEG